jgi:hypothetical protein
MSLVKKRGYFTMDYNKCPRFDHQSGTIRMGLGPTQHQPLIPSPRKESRE